uniref:Uncharacterized protein n=1 Tax=Rhizophora mucronata TaxID=61149 RepID=A0A2P2JP32_RHIMU
MLISPKVAQFKQTVVIN